MDDGAAERGPSFGEPAPGREEVGAGGDNGAEEGAGDAGAGAGGDADEGATRAVRAGGSDGTTGDPTT